MLVFARRRDAAIVIGDGIERRVLRIGREGVRLGLTAPADVAVHRREVYDGIGAAHRAAAADPTTVDSRAARLRQAARPTRSRS